MYSLRSVGFHSEQTGLASHTELMVWATALYILGGWLRVDTKNGLLIQSRCAGQVPTKEEQESSSP